MKKQKSIFLFLALIFPVCVFVFLKLFGKNEFAVEPLYADTYPETDPDCSAVIDLPYYIPNSIRLQLPIGEDSLVLVVFGEMENESRNQIKRIEEEFTGDAFEIFRLPASDDSHNLRRCIFFLQEPFDLALVDRRGAIRGQYSSSDREDIDRLLTEVTIILKKY